MGVWVCGLGCMMVDWDWDGVVDGGWCGVCGHLIRIWGLCDVEVTCSRIENDEGGVDE